MRVKSYQNDQNPRKRLIARLILQPRDLLVTLFMLNTLINILIQNVFSSMFGIEASWQLKVGCPLVVMLFFGEIFPKYYGLQNNLNLSYRVAPSVDFLQRMLRPMRKWMIAITTPISQKAFFFLKKEEDISNEELKHVLKTSEAHGVLNSDEAKLIWGYLNLQDTLVKELLNPREDMECFDITEPLNKLIHLFAEKKHTRLPVFDGVKENIIGIISAKQFLLHQGEIKESRDIEKWLSKPFYIPENTPARNLLRRFDKERQEMAIVVNEYGSISGLITREDVIESVIGKIVETDESKVLFTQSRENEIIANGKLELNAFNEIFDSNIESPTGMVTLSGWLIEQLGEIPASGKKYNTKEFLFHILEADHKRIQRVYARKLNKVVASSKTNSRK
jgi:putative hemolysin